MKGDKDGVGDRQGQGDWDWDGEGDTGCFTESLALTTSLLCELSDCIVSYRSVLSLKLRNRLLPLS